MGKAKGVAEKGKSRATRAEGVGDGQKQLPAVQRESLSSGLFSIFNTTLDPVADVHVQPTEQTGIGAIDVSGTAVRTDGSFLAGIYVLVQSGAASNPPTNQDIIDYGMFLSPSSVQGDGSWELQGVPGASYGNPLGVLNTIYVVSEWSNAFFETEFERAEEEFNALPPVIASVGRARGQVEFRDVRGILIDPNTYLFSIYSVEHPHYGSRLVLPDGNGLRATRISTAAYSVDWTLTTPLGPKRINTHDGLSPSMSHPQAATLRFRGNRLGAVTFYQFTNSGPRKIRSWPAPSGDFEDPDSIVLDNDQTSIYVTVNVPRYPWNTSGFSCSGGFALYVKKLA